MSDQAVNQVFEKVSFVNKISVILKATADEDKPIPGYLYKDISNITYESEGYCESTVEYLVDRLDKQSCHVKLKALKLMKYLVENGHKNFRLGLIKHSTGITEATKFSGPLDPLHGNVPYLVIRKTAQELSEILFDTEKSESSPRKPTNTGQDGMGRTIGIHSKMEGFGSSQVQPKKTFSENLVENISKLAEKMTETPVDHQREILSSIQNVGGYRPPGGCHDNPPVSTIQLNKPDVQQRKVIPVRKHVPGKAGGGWDDEEEEDIGFPQNNASHLSDRRSGNSEELSDRIEGLTVEDWTSEENLVMTTVDSGQTLLLTLQQIKSFIKECSQINCEKIIELLNQRLSSDSDIQNMRSLLLLENVLMTDLVSMEFILSTCRGNLLWLVQNRKGAIYSKARKVVRIIEKLTNVMLLEINVPPKLQGQLIETNCENKDLMFPVPTDQSVSKVTMHETVHIPEDGSPSQSEDLLHGDNNNIELHNVESET